MGGGPTKELVLIAVPFPRDEKILTSFQSRFPGHEFHWQQVTISFNPAEILPQIPAELWPRTTVLATLVAFPAPSSAPNLALIHLVSAGSNQIQSHPLYTSTNIPITTSSGIHGPQIAEWVVMTGLVASHHYTKFYEQQKQREWLRLKAESDWAQVRDWVGRRIGILGYGSIGRQVGRVAKAMGMEVVAFTATPKDTPASRRDEGFVVPGTGDVEGEVPVEWYSGLDVESRRKFLSANIDWLVVAVPLTEQTKHFLSTEEFKVLSDGGKRPAYVTNIARGQIIDQEALIVALKDGTLSGAALDVTDPEPLPKESELWTLSNVIITPHISGSGSSYAERTFKILEINLARKEKGEKLLNEVNRKKGY